MVRWGVMGPGAIAVGFADAMRLVDDGEIVAVASRAAERADAFGDRFAIPNRYDSYAGLGEDPNVDVVYVATPQSRHAPDTLAMLRAGKHVLCEKPFALNAGSARQMVEEGRARGLFLMEAIWSRFLPSYRAIVDVLGAGRVGEPLLVEADFGFRRPVDPEDRLFRLDLGGGGLLDLGIYPIQLCSLVLGSPRACRRGGGHRGDGSRRASGGSVASPRRQTWCRQSLVACRHDLHSPDLGYRGLDRRPGSHALPECHHHCNRGRIRTHRLPLRRQRAALRDRRGPALPGGGRDRESQSCRSTRRWSSPTRSTRSANRSDWSFQESNSTARRSGPSSPTAIGRGPHRRRARRASGSASHAARSTECGFHVVADSPGSRRLRGCRWRG